MVWEWCKLCNYECSMQWVSVEFTMRYDKIRSFRVALCCMIQKVLLCDKRCSWEDTQQSYPYSVLYSHGAVWCCMICYLFVIASLTFWLNSDWIALAAVNSCCSTKYWWIIMFKSCLMIGSDGSKTLEHLVISTIFDYWETLWGQYDMKKQLCGVIYELT